MNRFDRSVTPHHQFLLISHCQFLRVVISIYRTSWSDCGSEIHAYIYVVGGQGHSVLPEQWLKTIGWSYFISIIKNICSSHRHGVVPLVRLDRFWTTWAMTSHGPQPVLSLYDSPPPYPLYMKHLSGLVWEDDVWYRVTVLATSLHACHESCVDISGCCIITSIRVALSNTHRKGSTQYSRAWLCILIPLYYLCLWVRLHTLTSSSTVCGDGSSLLLSSAEVASSQCGSHCSWWDPVMLTLEHAAGQRSRLEWLSRTGGWSWKILTETPLKLILNVEV